MDILILGGTAWLGRRCAAVAIARGHTVTCLARGQSGPTEAGANFVAADRREPEAYRAIRDQHFDAAIEVSWQPGMVREATAALRDSCDHFIYISSVSAYKDHDTPDADESAELLEAHDADVATLEDYGEAKVACEQAVLDAFSTRTMVARAGLIGGPGDVSGRSGAWVARAARDNKGPLLVPTGGCAVQVIGVDDLARWIVHCAEERTVGVFNAVGPTQSFHDWVERSRAIGGHTGDVVEVDGEFFSTHGVGVWMGPESLAMWVPTRGRRGWGRTSGAKAIGAGLEHQDRDALLEQTLSWERAQGLDRPRGAGLSEARERELLAVYSASVPQKSGTFGPVVEPDRGLD